MMAAGQHDPNVLNAMAAFMSGSAPPPAGFLTQDQTTAPADYMFTGYHTSSVDTFLDPSTTRPDHAGPSLHAPHAQQHHSDFPRRLETMDGVAQGLGILSSDTHDDTQVIQDARLSRPDTALRPSFGGVYVTGEPGLDDHGPRKRSRTSQQSEEEANPQKSRGRPRLDTRDENASDRRRTQIRLAQRAYRLRKETTISSLKKQVESLENTIEQMNRSFLQFNDVALQSGLVQSRPALAENLKSTAQEFLSLARAVQSDSEVELDEQSEENPKSAPPLVDPATEGPRKALVKTDIRQRKQISKASPPSVQCRGTNHGAVPQQNYDPMDANRPVVQVIPANTSPQRFAPSQPYDAAQQYGVTVPDPNQWNRSTPTTVPPQIPSMQGLNRSQMSTIAQESTFGRRLRRHCLETGFKLLVNPDAPEKARNRVFKYSFLYMGKEQLVSNLYQLLLAMNGDPNHPTESLRHRSRRAICGSDGRGVVAYRPLLGPSSAGPLTTGRVIPVGEDASPDEVTSDMIMEMAGMEGEWYGPEDIEQYLREKGVEVNNRTSYVEVSVDDLSQDHLTLPDSPESMAPLSGSRSAAASRQSPSTTPPATSGAFTDMTALGATHGSQASSQLVAVDMSQLGGDFRSTLPPTQYRRDLGVPVQNYSTDSFGLSLVGVDPLNVPHAFAGPSSGAKPQTKKRLMTLDISLLMKTITGRGACLGVSPGFRKVDVDTAIQLAMQST